MPLVAYHFTLSAVVVEVKPAFRFKWDPMRESARLFLTCRISKRVLKSALTDPSPLNVMSQHASLKKSSNVGTKRSVLKRFERVKLMQKRGEWVQGRTPLGLPKTTPEA